MPFMIAHGASVVIVRDGKRKTIPAGGSATFTEEEIIAVNRAAPGSLRKPVNEGRSEDDANADAPTTPAKKAPKNETAKQKKARETQEAADQAKAEEAKAAAAKAKAEAETGDDDDDEDEDGDI